MRCATVIIEGMGKRGTSTKPKSRRSSRVSTAVNRTPEPRTLKPYYPFEPPHESIPLESMGLCLWMQRAVNWHDEKRLANEQRELDAKREAQRRERDEMHARDPEKRRIFDDLMAIQEKILENPDKYDRAWFRKNRDELQNCGALKWVRFAVKNARQYKEKVKDFGRAREILNACKQIQNGMRVLRNGVLEGREDAAIDLLDLAFEATVLLTRVYRHKPQLVTKNAALMPTIPVLLGPEEKWFREASEHVERLRVSSNDLSTRLKALPCDDPNDNAQLVRAWAKAAVRCIQKNQSIPVLIAVLTPYLVEMSRRKQNEPLPRLKPSSYPDWVKDAERLPPLRKDSLRQWGAAIRKMLRAEVPNLHERKEWRRLAENVRRPITFMPGCRTQRPGTIQNRILDRIIDAFETMASGVAGEMMRDSGNRISGA